MDRMKIYAIGDIHGSHQKMKDLLERIDYAQNDHLIFLGDYVDRGNNSSGVIGELKDLAKWHKHLHILMGNHDQVFIDWCRGVNIWGDSWYLKYLSTTKQSYGVDVEWMNSDADFLKERCENFVRINDFIFSHSGGNPWLRVNEHGADEWLWERNNEDAPAPYLLDKGYRVFGHTPIKEPQIGNHRAMLDTGACFPEGKLTCAVWDEYDTSQPIEIIQV